MNHLPAFKKVSVRDILQQSWAAPVPAKPLQFGSPKKQKLADIIRAKKLHR
jgi:hypothetical protein